MTKKQKIKALVHNARALVIKRKEKLRIEIFYVVEYGWRVKIKVRADS